MHKTIFLVVLVNIATANEAAASNYVLNVIAEPSQVSSYDNGTENIDDVQPNTIVRLIEPREATDRHGTFAVLALNRGTIPVNFGPENVVLRMPDGSRVAMLDYNELMHRQKKREGWQRFGMALAAGSRGAANNGYSSGTVNYSGQTNGTYGSTPYSARTTGTATYSGYDAGAANAAQSQANEQTRREVETMRAKQQQARNEIQNLMQTTTVAPQRISGGGVQFDMPKSIKSSKSSVPITIEVTVGDEKHLFNGTLTKK